MANLRIIFLGTSGGMPSKKRSLPSIAIKYEGELIIFDCGEGTQRQMLIGKIGFKKDFKIFISHLHGDHILGIPGLLYTMNMLDRKYSIQIFGPKGIKDSIEKLMSASIGKIDFPIEIYEIDEGNIIETKKYSIKAINGNHVIKSLAYCFEEKNRPGKMIIEKLRELGIPQGPLWGKLQRGESINFKGKIINPNEVTTPPRPGRKIVYSGDTRPCEKILNIAKNADVLIHDSSFDDSLKNKAFEEGHSTSLEAANIAKEANVNKLFLFHISPRYEKDDSILLKEARKVFPNCEIAEDFLIYEVPYKSI